LKRLLKAVFWCVILSVVAWFIVQAFVDARESFQERNFSLAELDYALLACAGAIYIIGLAPCWWYWRRTMHAMGQQSPFLGSIAAYYIGHLGKYVPGKAMVVVLRASFIRGAGVDTAVAASSVFVETLTMMAVGASLAAVILAFSFSQPLYIAVAVGLAIAAAIPTFPPLFCRLMKLLRIDRQAASGRWFSEGITFRLMAVGWLSMIPVWICLGASMLLTMEAIGTARIPGGVFLSDLPYLTATVSLAMVAGFLSLVPGGLGVRDSIVIGLISTHPRFGGDVAIISAVVLRIIWLVSELTVSGILYYSGSSNRPSLPPDGHTNNEIDSGNSGS